MPPPLSPPPYSPLFSFHEPMPPPKIASVVLSSNFVSLNDAAAAITAAVFYLNFVTSSDAVAAMTADVVASSAVSSSATAAATAAVFSSTLVSSTDTAAATAATVFGSTIIRPPMTPLSVRVLLAFVVALQRSSIGRFYRDIERACGQIGWHPMWSHVRSISYRANMRPHWAASDDFTGMIPVKSSDAASNQPEIASQWT